jgi:hypothetical protein
MRWQWVVGVVLALAAVALLARDLRRAGSDPLRRPATLFMASLVVVVLAGTFGARQLPNPWWLLLPAGVLAWEAARGWRQLPRCRLREGGMAAWAVGLALTAVGLARGGSLAAALLGGAAAAFLLGAILVWRSRSREPQPWRGADREHYERRDAPRPPGA